MRMVSMIPALVLLAPPAFADIVATSHVDGPVAAVVRSVIDGDSFRADAVVWPGHTVSVVIRIRGIDAPERRARCAAERDRARQARDALAAMIAESSVIVSNIGGGKCYGRVLADVATSNGRPVAAALLSLNVVRPYDGGRRAGWCG